MSDFESDTGHPTPDTGHGRSGHLAFAVGHRHHGLIDEESGIYREEVMLILGALADITSNTHAILAILEGEDEDDEEEEADS